MTARVEDQAQTKPSDETDRLRIVHVMRAPVGGLFRHVVDLARAQAQGGHLVGVISDSTTGGDAAARTFEALEPHLALGLTRLPMHRLPHPSDLVVAFQIARRLRRLEPHVMHGHGAKGGLYARLPALLPGFTTSARRMALVYTPHGGSLHFPPGSLAARLFFSVERALERVTDFMPFESAFAKRRFIELIGEPRALAPIVHNGLAEAEFEPAAPAPDAADFVYVGELRKCKGVDTLIEALARLPDAPRLALVGSGPDETAFRTLARQRGVAGRVSFLAPMGARDAFRRGRVLVTPSRAESLPYVVLEAIAARLPVVATNVGGIPEIFGPQAARLVASDDPAALAEAMRVMSAMPAFERAALAGEMADYAQARFTLAKMAQGVLRGYRDALRSASAADYIPSAHLRTGE